MSGRSARPPAPRRPRERPRPGPGSSPAPARCLRRGAGVALRQVALAEHDPVVAQDVVGVELAGLDQLHLGKVAERPGDGGVEALDDHEHTPVQPERGERRLGVLRLRCAEPPVVDDDDLAAGGAVRQRRAQRQLDHLLRSALDVRARLRAEGDAAAGELRRPRRPLAGVARALLPVRLGAAAADLAARLRAVGAGPAVGQLRRDDLVHHGHVGPDPEHRVVELDAPGVPTGRRLQRDLGHQDSFDRLLGGVADEDDTAVRAGYRALDQQQVALRVGLDDLEVERRDLLVAHLASHPHALEHAAGVGAGTDRTGCPVVLVVAVAGTLTLEVVALHRPGEAFASADGRHVDLGSCGDAVHGDLLADLVAIDVLETQLDEAVARIDRHLGEVAGLGLVQLPGVAVAVRHLQGAVAVTLGRLDLHDTHGLDAQDRDRDDPVIDPLLAHADFLADDRGGCHGGWFLAVIPSGLKAAHASAPQATGRRSTRMDCRRAVPVTGRTRTSVAKRSGPGNATGTQVEPANRRRSHSVRRNRSL